MIMRQMHTKASNDIFTLTIFIFVVYLSVAFRFKLIHVPAHNLSSFLKNSSDRLFLFSSRLTLPWWFILNDSTRFSSTVSCPFKLTSTIQIACNFTHFDSWRNRFLKKVVGNSDLSMRTEWASLFTIGTSASLKSLHFTSFNQTSVNSWYSLILRHVANKPFVACDLGLRNLIAHSFVPFLTSCFVRLVSNNKSFDMKLKSYILLGTKTGVVFSSSRWW